MHGAGETYNSDGSPSRSHLLPEWHWERGLVSYEAVCCDRDAFFGRLPEPHPVRGGPVLVWRVGIADVGALKDQTLMDGFKRALTAHIEDCFQFSRAASRRRNMLSLASLVVDAQGLGISIIKHLPLIKHLIEDFSQYPEAV